MPRRRTEKMFPIQGEHDWRNNIDRPYGAVPWAVAEIAYKTYVEWYGSNQSLETLASRGGFGWTELVSLLKQDKQQIRETIPATNTVEV